MTVYSSVGGRSHVVPDFPPSPALCTVVSSSFVHLHALSPASSPHHPSHKLILQTNGLANAHFLFPASSLRGSPFPHRRKSIFIVRAEEQQPSSSSSSSVPLPSADSSKRKDNFFPSVLHIPKSIWRQLVNPLNNFGFGQRSIWEGGVGIFIVSGVVLFSLTVGWLKGYQIKSRTQRYHAVIEFSKANGICAGTPVRMRGVDIGSVVSVRPSLESINVTVQIFDAKVVIPRNALVEVNQSGLLMDTLIDITPPNRLQKPTVGPLDPYCTEEGAIVCDRQKIKGEQGVNLDELVSIFTRLAKEVDEIGVTEIYSLADRVGKAVDDAKPLLRKLTDLVGEVEPLLKEVQNGGLVKELESLTKVLNVAMVDVKTLNDSVLTADNRELLQQSVSTLTKTLKNIESISGDVSSITGDARTRQNLKHLIEALNNLLAK